jgi:hypothetical protein
VARDQVARPAQRAAADRDDGRDGPRHRARWDDFVETVFGLPGLGGLAATSLRTRDLPVLLGIVTYTTVAIVLLNLVVDLLYGVIDPRARLYQADFEGTVEPKPAQAQMPTLEPAS